MDDKSSSALSPDVCRDESALKSFVQSRISVNAWPIHSAPLRRLIHDRGLDLAEAERFTMSLAEMEAMMRRFHRKAHRVERVLGIHNAFHRPLHNFEVLLRLFLLEWPSGTPPEDVRRAPTQLYTTLESIIPTLLEIARGLLERGVPSHRIARNILAALGHDYGHSGGTDRVDLKGRPTPLTHEEVAEKHIALLGIECGLPPSLILESLAGIRATTFYSRPGREMVRPTTEFERKLTLADVMGCVLPPVEWLTHVGIPVLKEKIPTWRRRLAQLPGEIARVRAEIAELQEGSPEQTRKEDELALLLAEDARIVKDIKEWLKSEHGFFLFIETQKLAPVGGARELWGEALRDKIVLMERLLDREELIEPLAALGFPFLEEYASALSNAESVEALLHREDVDPRLRQLLSAFLALAGERG